MSIPSKDILFSTHSHAPTLLCGTVIKENGAGMMNREASVLVRAGDGSGREVLGLRSGEGRVDRLAGRCEAVRALLQQEDTIPEQ